MNRTTYWNNGVTSRFDQMVTVQRQCTVVQGLPCVVYISWDAVGDGRCMRMWWFSTQVLLIAFGVERQASLQVLFRKPGGPKHEQEGNSIVAIAWHCVRML